MAIFDDLQNCKLSKRWEGGPKKVKIRDNVILEWSLSKICSDLSLFECIVLVISKNLQILGLQSRISKVFLDH